MKVLLGGLCLLIVGTLACGQTAIPTPTVADPALYGDYPTNYKMIVLGWLYKRLYDPASSQIEWTDGPIPADLGNNSQHVYGYVVHFRVNSRNRFGGYTGWQKHGALIHNGEVIKGLGGLGY